MMLPALVRVLREPAAAAQLELPEWELLLRQALAANVTAALAHLLESSGVTAPQAVQRHLDWAATQARRHAQAVAWEIRQIGAALARVDTPVVLLKGAAYAACAMDAGQGRMFSDIDILVTRASLGEVEAALLLHGWAAAKTDAYDQRYYRAWMHEIPPMVHLQRDTAIDVHHSILPLTARARPDPARLLAAARPAPAGQEMPVRMQVLAPVDMLLHSATHLFYESEFHHGLRDLLDIDRLLRELGADPAFWADLVPRARELQLERPLFYALRYAVWLLGTPVPEGLRLQLAPCAPGPLVLACMDALFQRALLPPHASCSGAGRTVAEFLLYLRGNWLRMPPLLLARHLFHKAFLSPRD